MAVLGYAGKVVGDAAYDAQAGEGDADAVAGFVQGGVFFEEGEDGDDACGVEVSEYGRGDKRNGRGWSMHLPPMLPNATCHADPTLLR